MNCQHSLIASFVVALACLVLPAKGADEPKAEAPAADSFVKITVPVEINGILRQTDQGFFITAHQEGIYESPGSDFGLTKRDVQKVATTWELDFGKMKGLRKAGEQFKDKKVVVTGTALLRPVVVQNLNQGIRSYPKSTWEVVHRIAVSTLKEAGQE